MHARLRVAARVNDESSRPHHGRPSIPEHAVETYLWPLLGFQTAEVTPIEIGRYHFDALMAAGADDATRMQQRGELLKLFATQLANSLEHVPEGIGTGVL